jgi:glycosyltransferase involved in cell wall biosynthesis
MTRNKTILILTSAHLCRNPRVVKEATTLGAAGYEVTVMSTSVQTRFEQMDRELMRGLPCKLMVLDYAADTTVARTADFFQRGATWAARKLCSSLGLETAQTLGPASALLRFARTFPADLTIVHTEIPIWAAQYLIQDGRRVAVDVEDWYSEDLLYADRQSRPLKLLRHAEEFALRYSAYTSATAQSMADALTAAYHCPPPIVIRNTFPLQPRSRADAPSTNDPPRFIWFSQTIGPGRGLELFLAAWIRTTRPSQVYLLGDDRPDYREKLVSRLPAARRSDLHFIPPVPPDELPSRLAEFDIGLALEPRWPLNRNITISNKIFQYMNAGLAVVATNTDGQMEVMKAAPECGLLIVPHETAEYAQKLDTLLSDRRHLRATQLAARAAAEREFCWERETPRLLAAVENALH